MRHDVERMYGVGLDECQGGVNMGQWVVGGREDTQLWWTRQG
jgi:hypothetical protein